MSHVAGLLQAAIAGDSSPVLPWRSPWRRGVRAMAGLRPTTKALRVRRPETAVEQSDEPLRVWVRQAAGEGLPTYEAMGELYTEQTGQEIEWFGEVTQFEQTLIRASAAQDLPDMIINDTASLGQLVDWGLAQEIDRGAVAGNEDIIDVAWEAAQGSDGNYYGVPTSTQAFNLYVRSDWRESLGLDQPQTMDDLVDLTRAFTYDDPDGDGADNTCGFVVPASTQRGYASWFWQSFLWSFGGEYMELMDDGNYRPAFTDDEAVAAMEWLKDMFFEHEVVQPGAINHVTADSHPYFLTGECGVYHTGPYMIPTFTDSVGDDAFEVVKPVDGPGGTYTLAEGENSYIMAGTEKFDQALAFASWIASPDGQEAGIQAPEGANPVVRLSINTNVNTAEVLDDPRWDVVAETFAESGRYVPAVPNWQPFRQIVADAVNAAVASADSDVGAILEAANEEVAEELSNQGVLHE